MHRKVRKKKTSKLAANSGARSNSKRRASHFRMLKERRKSRTKYKTKVTESTSSSTSDSAKSGKNCQKKSQLRKKEKEWRRNAIDPTTLPSPQFDVPRKRSITAWDEKPIYLDRPLSASVLDRPQNTYDVIPRRGRSRGPPDSPGTPPLPHIFTRSCRNSTPVAVLMKRIKSIHIPGRPYPDTSNMEVLIHELKLRLATTVPLIQGKVDKSGLFHFTELPAESRRHVTMYDITDDDDIHKACDVRIPKPSPAALLLDSMLRENRTRHQAMDVGNSNDNNNNCMNQSTSHSELGVINIDSNSTSPLTRRLNCQVM